MSLFIILLDILPKFGIPIELCEYISEFGDEEIPLRLNKSNRLIGWNYVFIYKRKWSEILDLNDLDICGLCYNWKYKCECKFIN